MPPSTTRVEYQTAAGYDTRQNVHTNAMPARLTRSVAALTLTSALCAQGFAAPQRLKAGDEFIETNVGHSAPYLYDFDGDGRRDLLVGEFGIAQQGKLRIYRNIGSDTDPKYGEHDWFEAGGTTGAVPTG